MGLFKRQGPRRVPPALLTVVAGEFCGRNTHVSTPGRGSAKRRVRGRKAQSSMGKIIFLEVLRLRAIKVLFPIDPRGASLRIADLLGGETKAGWAG